MERDFELNNSARESVNEQKNHKKRFTLAPNQKTKTLLKVGLLAFGIGCTPLREPVLNTGIMVGQVVTKSLETIRNADLFKRSDPLANSKNKGNQNSAVNTAKEERPFYELVIDSADIQRMAEFTGSKIRLNATHTARIPTQGALRFVSPAREFDAKSKTNVYLVVDLKRSFIDGEKYSKTIYLDEAPQKADFSSNENAIKLYVPPVKISSIEVEDFKITRKIESALLRIKPEDEEKAIAQYRKEVREIINNDKEYYNFVASVTYDNLEKALENLFGVNFSVIPLSNPDEQKNAHEQENRNDTTSKKDKPDFEMTSEVDKVLLAIDRFQNVPGLTGN